MLHVPPYKFANVVFRGEENSDEALGPDIKPPQAKVKKDKHKHKHKRDKRKTGERERHSDRGDKSRGE